MADTPGAAWALAHASAETAVIAEAGQMAAALAPLPVWSLRIDEQTTEALASVGVETVGALLYLPRSSLHSRFGRVLLERIDQALGDLPEMLTPYRPVPVLTERLCFGASVTQLDLLTEAVRRALAPFCEQLARKVAGVRRMFLTLDCVEAAEQRAATRPITLPVELSSPTRSVDHLWRLIRVRLEGLRLPAPAEALTLWADQIEPLDGWQEELFATDEADAREMGNLLDRLVARLGVDAVLRPRLLDEHQPERAFRFVSVVESTAADPAKAMAVLPRPLRLVSPPIEIAATSLVPDGPPIAFRLRGTSYGIEQSAGPERIETGWWRGPHIQRDYYRVITQDGRRCWLFRNRPTGQWFLQGWFD
jgi:protein ImuB